MNFEFYKKRWWNQIRSVWIDLPIDEGVFNEPEYPYYDSWRQSGGSKFQDSLNTTDTHEEAFENQRAFFYIHFNESLVFLMRAMHALSATEKHIELGYQTWSSLESYQGALYAARALIGFLGGGWIECSTNPIYYDFFTLDKSNKLREVVTYRMGDQRAGHNETWSALIRLLGVVNFGNLSDSPSFPKTSINKIKSLNARIISQSRNSIAYRNIAWASGDLFECKVDENFGLIPRFPQDHHLTIKNTDFYVCYLSSLIGISITLLSDIAKDVQVLGEFKNRAQIESTARNGRFVDTFTQVWTDG